MARFSLVVSILMLLSVLPAAASEHALSGTDVVYTGAYSDDWGAGWDLRQHSAIGQPLTFGGTFHHPTEGMTNTHWILDQIWFAGATPVANLEIFATSYEVAAGFQDAELTEWATSVQIWLERDPTRSLLIAPMAEMNGDWVTWGMDPLNYQIAFRHIRDLFIEMGMDETKVRWVFAPNASSTWPHTIASYWPGADLVDAIGLSAYNRGGTEWYSLQEVVDPALLELREIAPDKPYLLTQVGTGSSGGNKDQWLIDMFEYTASDPNLVGFVYFNFDKEADWKVWDDAGVAWGWLKGNVDPRVKYEFPLTSWFQPGPLAFNGQVVPQPAVEVIVPEVPAPEPSFTGSEAIATLVHSRRFFTAARPE